MTTRRLALTLAVLNVALLAYIVAAPHTMAQGAAPVLRGRALEIVAAGLSLVGASDRTHVLLKAEGASSSLKLADGDGRAQVVKP